jgi:hypothetical protein
MMNSTLQNDVLAHGECLLAGRYDAVLPCYQEVLPVFVDGKAMLMDGHDALRAALSNLRERLLYEGVIRSVGRLTSGEQIEKDRFRFCVDWDYYSSINGAPKTSSTVYFCVRGTHRSMVEMVEYRKQAFPNIIGWKRFDMIAIRTTKRTKSKYYH